MNSPKTIYSSIKYEIVYQAPHGTWYHWGDKISAYNDQIPTEVHTLLAVCKKERPTALGYKIIRTRLETTETKC